MVVRSLTLVIIGLFLAQCSQRKVIKEQPPANAAEATPEAMQSWMWAYEGDKGPNNWSQINPEYTLCSTGKSQSPINLVWKKPSKPNPLEVRYAEGDVVLSNTGYTYRLEFTPQSRIVLNGQEYLLEKAEIRTPSEHQLSGHAMPMEIQFYHRTPNGLRQAIISIFAVAGKPSDWFSNLWKVAMDTAKYKASPTIRMNPDILIPPRRTFYYYQGSLTHPPCLEGVEWIVFNTPIQLSAEQITMLRNSYNNNNRPLQELNGRTVTNF